MAERSGTLKIREDRPGASAPAKDTPATMTVTPPGAQHQAGPAAKSHPGQAPQTLPGRGIGAARTTFAATAAADKAVLANLTDQQWIVHRTYGTYIVPACAEGAPYALLEVTPRLGRIDLGDRREFEFPITAREIAADIAREINSDAGEDSDFGVFVCAGERPSGPEIAAARARIESFYKRIVVLADQEWERAHNAMTISDVQRRAARWLKLEREWFYEPQRQADCPACGERIRPGVAVCRTCGAVLDQAKAAQFGLAAAPPPGPAAPPAKTADPRG
jgi:hypothetical protein